MTTLAIVLIVIVAAVIITGSQLQFAPAGNVYSGRVTVNLVQIKRIDGAAYGIADSQMRVIHGSMDYNDKVGTLTGDTITGDLNKADKGTWYLIVDYGTNTTLWLDSAETSKSEYVAKIFGNDGDRDGFDETYIQLDLSTLAPLVAGENAKVVDLTLINCPARISSIDFTSLMNVTGISASAYGYHSATGYMDGFSEGDEGKLAKVILDFSASGNQTYPDTNAWMLTQLKIGAYTLTGSQFGTYDLANKRYLILFGDQINSAGGRDFYYEKNAGTLWASYELKAYCKYPTTNKRILVTMSFYFYKPDGTISSAFSQVIEFNSY
jgi:hypothetical protein